MRDAGAPALDFSGIAKSFGTVAALTGVDLVLERTGAIGLLGPNGAGKSTLIGLALGFFPPTRGTGRVLGVALDRPLEIRRRVGYLPEDDAWFDGATGMEMVAYSARLAGIPRRRAVARAHDVLGYVGLADARHRKVEEYSRGMRQRVKLAHALAADPELLLLDEPATGLDPPGRDQMLALVADLATRHGKTVVLSTHLLPDVERCCERVVLLAGGRVAASGRLAELLAADAGRYHVRLRDGGARFRAALESRGIRTRDAAPGLALGVGGGPLECDLGAAATRVLFEVAREAGDEIRSLVPARRTLEALFVERSAVPSEGN